MGLTSGLSDQGRRVLAWFNRLQAIKNGILMIAVGLVGFLGVLYHLEIGDPAMAALQGIISPVDLAIGVRCLRIARLTAPSLPIRCPRAGDQ